MENSLKKSLKGFDYFSLAFGTIIGAGWVLVVGDWLTQGGALGAALAFILGGIALLSVGSCYAELCAAFPIAGGAITFCKKAFGRTPGFMAGWMLLGGYAAICPWEAVSISRLLAYLLPGLNQVPLYTVAGHTIYLYQLIISIALILFVALLNYKGISFGIMVQKTVTLFLLCLCALFIVVGLFRGSAQNLVPLFSGGNAGEALGGFVSVLVIIPFFMCGFESIPQGAEEASDSFTKKKFGKVILSSIMVAALFYAVIIITAASMAPREQLLSGGLVTAEAFRICFNSPFMGSLVVVGAILGLISCCNGCFLSATRVLLGMSRERMLPASLKKINPKTQTPVRAIQVIALISIACCFLGRSVLTIALNITSFFFVGVWLMVSASCLKLRYSMPDLERPYVLKGGKIVIWTAILITALIIILMLIPNSPGSMAWPAEYLTILVWIIAGMAVYMVCRRRYDSSVREKR